MAKDIKKLRQQFQNKTQLLHTSDLPQLLLSVIYYLTIIALRNRKEMTPLQINIQQWQENFGAERLLSSN